MSSSSEEEPMDEEKRRKRQKIKCCVTHLLTKQCSCLFINVQGNFRDWFTK